MKYLSVCSGMEAASVAWEPLGWSPVAFSEIEPFPSAILKHRFPNIPNYGDLTKFQQWPIGLGSIDLLVGGTPCQSFSVAGLRKGLDDPRGNLALVFLGLVDRLQPKWVVWENVPGVLSSNGGRDFGSFLGALVKLGYGFAYRVLDAQFVGRCGMHSQGSGWDAVPQRRRRVFVVACRGSGGWESAASVLFKPESLRWHPSKGRKKGQEIARNSGSGVETGGPIAFRKSKRASSTTDNETWVEADASNTLNNFDLGDTRTTHAMVEPVAIQGTIIGRGENAGPQGVGATEGGPMFTLTKTDIHAVCFEPRSQDGHARVCGDVSPTLNTAQGGQRQPCIAFQPGNLARQAGAEPSEESFPTLSRDSGDQNPHIAFPYSVRRLSPRETERLQGFPDDWSQIPWNGKPADQCPDGPRYRACGNSMAVPVMRWIGEQIARVKKESK